MAKELKKIISKHLEARFGQLTGCVLIDYRRLNSEQTQDLRSSLRKNGVTMSIVQNRLVRRIFGLHGAPESFQTLLKGPTAVLYAGDGAVSASKSIVQWRKKNKDRAAIKGGLLEGRLLSVAEVESLATLPDVPTLQAGLVSRLLGPLYHLATVTAGLLSHLSSAAKAHRETLEKAEGGSEN